MAGELLPQFMHPDMHGVYDASKHGLVQTKTLVLSGLGIGTGLMVRNAMNKTKDEAKPNSGNRRPHFLKQNHRGLRHRKGVYTSEVVYPNSWVFLLNPLKGYDLVNLRDVVTDLKPFNVDSTERRKHLIEASVTWGHIADDGEGNTEYDMPYHKILEIALSKARSEAELSQAVGRLCNDGLRQVLAKRSSADLEGLDSSAEHEKLVSVCGDALLESYGAEIRRLSITNSSSANIPIDHFHPENSGAEGYLGEEQLGAAALGQFGQPNQHLQGL